MEKHPSFIDNLRIYFICLLAIDSCSGFSYCSQDPCLGNTLTLSNGSRSENCPDVQYSNCDAYISSGWYRVEIPMLNYCPTNGLGYSCGTTFPAWMNGTDPTVNDGIVDREVCLKGPRSCCDKTYAIQVKNCTDFIAYCLKPLGSCPEKYCFGTFGTCLSTTTATTTSHITVTVTDSITKKLKLAEIKPSDDIEQNTQLKEPYLGYIIGSVCLLVLVASVAIDVIVRRTKGKSSFQVGTMKYRQPDVQQPIIVQNTIEIRVCGCQVDKMQTDSPTFGDNHTKCCYHSTNSKTDKNVVSPIG